VAVTPLAGKAGTPNKVTAKQRETMDKLVLKYGSPLEKNLKIVQHYWEVREAELATSSRHRNMQKVREAEDKIHRGAELIAPYMHAKLQSIAQQSEVKQVTMAIRAPEPNSDSKAWLEAHKPKEIDARPVMEHMASPALRKFVDEMDQEQDALAEADDVVSRMNKRMGGN